MMSWAGQPPFGIREKDYFGEAVLTAVLYFVGVYWIGLIANLLFLYRIRQDVAHGVQVRNAGCLDALLALALLPLVLMAAAGIVMLLQALF